jgi:hypothetical protein
MSAACSKSTDGNGELGTDKQEEMDKNSGDSSDTESNKKENAQETDEDSANTFDETGDKLSEYTAQQIEYARVWLQLGPNQEIDELNVRIIPAGSPINPNDDTSANYPEDVIQLAGSRLVDGSVTYSGNGDGTINVYEVPLRWETSVPDDLDENYMKELTESIIENTELVYVDPGDDEKIIELIKLQKVHQ